MGHPRHPHPGHVLLSLPLRLDSCRRRCLSGAQTGANTRPPLQVPATAARAHPVTLGGRERGDGGTSRRGSGSAQVTFAWASPFSVQRPLRDSVWRGRGPGGPPEGPPLSREQGPQPTPATTGPVPGTPAAGTGTQTQKHTRVCREDTGERRPWVTGTDDWGRPQRADPVATGPGCVGTCTCHLDQGAPVISEPFTACKSDLKKWETHTHTHVWGTGGPQILHSEQAPREATAWKELSSSPPPMTVPTQQRRQTRKSRLAHEKFD